MPLKLKKAFANLGNNNEDGEDEEEQSDSWLKDMDIKEAKISNINYSQNKITSKRELERDNQNESVIFVTDVETQALEE